MEQEPISRNVECAYDQGYAQGFKEGDDQGYKEGLLDSLIIIRRHASDKMTPKALRIIEELIIKTLKDLK